MHPPVLIAVLSLSRRHFHRPAVRLFLLGVLVVWLASSFSFICTRPLLHQAHQAGPECPLAGHHGAGAGHDMPAGKSCADQPCLDEIQSADKSWSKPSALPAMTLFVLVCLGCVLLASTPIRGRIRLCPPGFPSVPLIYLYCVLRN